MERNANYALVGFASLILLVGLALFVFWLARLQFNRDFDIYDILFLEPVRGLSEGGEVHFNGIKVGEVTEIKLDERNPSRVRALARVNSNVPIKTDSFAQYKVPRFADVPRIDLHLMDRKDLPSVGAGNVLKTFSRDQRSAVQQINGLHPAALYDRLRVALPYQETRDYLANVVRARRQFVSLVDMAAK